MPVTMRHSDIFDYLEDFVNSKSQPWKNCTTARQSYFEYHVTARTSKDEELPKKTGVVEFEAVPVIESI